MADSHLRPPVKARFHFSDGITLSALATVLTAISDFDSRASTLISPSIFAPHDLVERFASLPPPVPKEGLRSKRPKIPRLSTQIKAHEKLVDEFGMRARLGAAVFRSPGYVDVDGSGALLKLVEILNSEGTSKEDRRVIVERIQAETDLLRSKSKLKHIEATLATVQILKSVGVPDEHLLRILAGDGTLIAQLGKPLACIETARTLGTLEGVEIVSQNEPPTDFSGRTRRIDVS